MQDGLRRMYGADETYPHGEDVFYYLTVYNEPIQQPAEPADVDVEGILKGVHRISAGTAGEIPAQIMASGVAVPWALEAQRILAADWNVKADVWSATPGTSCGARPSTASGTTCCTRRRSSGCRG